VVGIKVLKKSIFWTNQGFLPKTKTIFTEKKKIRWSAVKQFWPPPRDFSYLLVQKKTK
jgi:hypothetical protein